MSKHKPKLVPQAPHQTPPHLQNRIDGVRQRMPRPATFEDAIDRVEQVAPGMTNHPEVMSALITAYWHWPYMMTGYAPQWARGSDVETQLNAAEQ